ncbi:MULTISPECIES: DUF2785 domain-containing protein [unclassified Streptomyces]|uniref:DUF2785 domain-containing protein n=1 Tax=unclassified Streptomyces TaxID=2593676 RepID=UPI0038160090
MNADLVDWPSIAAADFPFPDFMPASRLADELSAVLVSPDPEIRDDHGYTAASRWIAEGHFDEILEALGDTATARFTHPEVQARTFAPLVLCSVLTRGHTVPGLISKEATERWYAGFTVWYPAEHDTRGWDDSLGWLHAVAHGADATAAFAKSLPGRRTELLELCALRMTNAQVDYRYAQSEDARLARALTRILQGPGLTREQATGWLSVAAKALEGVGPGPLPIWAFNTFATLQSLHVHLVRGLADEGVPPHAEAVAARTADLLRLPYRWLA